MSEVTLENHRLNSMLRDPVFRRLLPCLDTLVQAAQAQPSQPTCGSCGGGASLSVPHSTYDQTRRCIASLLDGSAELRQQLKQKLGATGLRLKYAGTNKIIVKKY